MIQQIAASAPRNNWPQRILSLNAHREAAVLPAFHAEMHCTFCRQPGAFVGPATACPLCWLADHLERPSIDDEARLIWLPEVPDQVVLSVMCREIHAQLRGLGERLHDDAPPRSLTRERERIYHLQEALLARRAAVVSRLDTDRPSELAAALRQMPHANRSSQDKLLAGLRLLPRGRFYDDEGETDLYPDLLEVSIRAGVLESSQTETPTNNQQGRT